VFKVEQNPVEKFRYLQVCLVCKFIIESSETEVKLCSNCQRPICQDCIKSMKGETFCSLNCEKEIVCNVRLASL